MVLLFKPQAQMTFATVQADRARLLDYCQSSKNKEIVIDLSQVTLCDSAGLALLLESKRLAKSMNKACQIQSMPDFMRSLAEFSGLDAII